MLNRLRLPPTPKRLNNAAPGASGAGRQVNILSLDGVIASRSDPRYTPAGLQVFEGVLHHESQVREAGGIRRLEFDCAVVAFGDTARRLQQLELPAAIALKGYIAPRSRRTQRLIVYITEFN